MNSRPTVPSLSLERVVPTLEMEEEGRLAPMPHNARR